MVLSFAADPVISRAAGQARADLDPGTDLLLDADEAGAQQHCRGSGKLRRQCVSLVSVV